MDAASEPVTRDGITDLTGGDDTGFMVWKSRIGKAADDEVGATFGRPLCACAREFPVFCHAVFSREAHDFWGWRSETQKRPPVEGWPWENKSQGCCACGLPLSSLCVLLNVAFEVDFSALRKEAFTTFLAAATKSVTTCFGAHACAEAVLAFTSALGWLIGAFHGEMG